MKVYWRAEKEMMLKFSNLKRIIPVMCVLVLSMPVLVACTFHNPAPVVEHSNAQTKRIQDSDGTYRVRPGDTMFGIAFSYGLDQRELAQWNNISEPYTIFPDQVLRLTASSQAPQNSQASSDAGDVKIYKAATPQSTSTRTYTTRDVPAVSAAQKPVPEAPTQKPVPEAPTQKPVPEAPTQKPVPEAPTQKPVPEAPVTNTVETTSSPPRPVSTPAPATSVAKAPVNTPAPKPAEAQSHADPSSWRWPTEGRLLHGFVAGDPARNGIDIAGKEGQAIKASASGTVVYSGNGLIGYGELIIIKHSDNMLSAYAHNKVRLAAEGQQVVAGETIAEMGRNDRNEQILHFEIRSHGKPVNPLTYLPKQ